MKIVHLMFSFTVGGAETMLKDIVNEQCKTDEVSIVILNDYIDETLMKSLDKRVNFICCGRRPGTNNPLPLLRMNYILYKLHPDIIHLHNLSMRKLVLWNYPCVATLHNTGLKPVSKKRINEYCAISQTVYDEWKENGEATRLITNGIKVESVRAKSSLFQDEIIHFIQVSRLLIKQKGQDLLIQAAGMLVKQGITNFKVHLVGTGPDEQYLRELLITPPLSDISLQKYVIFEGLKERSWVYNHLADYDIFVQPSRFEGFGLTVAEACAAKIGVLVSDNEGPLEIINGGRVGMTFRNGDVNDLAEKMKDIILCGYNQSMIEQAFQRVKEKYHVSRTAKDYLNLYREIIDRKRICL